MKKVSSVLPFVFIFSLIPMGAFSQAIPSDMMFASDSTRGSSPRIEKTAENLDRDISIKIANLPKNYSPIEESEKLKDYLYNLLATSSQYTFSSFTRSTDMEDALKKDLGNCLTSMKNKSFTLSSLTDPSLSLNMGRFNDTPGREGWPYQLSFKIGSQTLYESSGYLLYTEITGKTVPQAPNSFTPDYLNSRKTYDLYLDTVNVFERLFATNKNFINATINYMVVPSNDSSSYTLMLTHVDFTNILTNRNFKTIACNGTVSYISDIPLTIDLVDAQALGKSIQETNPEMPPKPISLPPRSKFSSCPDEPSCTSPRCTTPEKKPAKKITNYEASTTDKMDTYSALLYCLPGTLNFYEGENHNFSTLGYSLTYGFTDHFFAGLNLEGAFYKDGEPTFNFGHRGRSRRDGEESDSGTGTESETEDGNNGDLVRNYYFYDENPEEHYNMTIEDSPIVFTGILGFNWNVGQNFRMTAYGELGFMLDSPTIGSGVSLEYMTPSRNMGIFTAYTWYITDDDFYNKFTIGVHSLF